ncbi:bifunctional UDP-N-acetylglucosamine pyrophosphorylase/glucosamine-1-phosphate N-acetyltransferase [Tumebacillus sp. BK434]|uniref:bifunctional UDP-N-acetylglucosamine diphosphorylase/glucosamine-1-phosphate N-acetyltransferase GlmU n=1 Tax=Tumebacillus sp. BK434 TaxID=2512169 RepID=UPI00104BDCC9|nr:bifunctional UDP-N-acetylglucosamine diphosphorylase/glucosamine-1-phosphate N-acetyltransferase GlmU [Tumebacillus sp. BK434]TCP52708.1 bifunctional UDP-N-acetylglucosamine pyrophosphorylase/glucosamine-1-phosphate N-acetyltransferase [Tumebacillus sp. BK434]
MAGTYAVVLAAGMGTRMKSKKHKVLHEICGKPMIQHMLDTLTATGFDRKVIIVGASKEQVMETLGEQEYAVQAEQLGTAHAVMMAQDKLGHEEGLTLVCAGDTPIIRQETLERMLLAHKASGAAVTVLTAVVENPFGLGRIIRDDAGNVLRIVEEKDASAEERLVREINSSVFLYDNQLLFHALGQIDNNNAQGEYYLPDCLEVLRREGHKVNAFVTDDPREIQGINDRAQLAIANEIIRERIALTHMKNGVTFIDPKNTYIDAGVEIGADTVIWPGTVLQGNTVIGADCTIGPNAHFVNVTVQDGVTVKHSVLTDAVVENQAAVGPFAYLRPKAHIGAGAKIGDFVEIKNATIGAGSKVSHLSYIGDAEVGAGVNVGCGTITVNYDGVKKHKTIIGDNTFVGCNSNLVAPVTLGQNVYVAAGSTVTADVPDGALAIARERQVNKEGYTEKLQARLKQEKS